MAPSDNPNTDGTVVPYVSWVVAVLSTVPVGFVVIGILIWHFVLGRGQQRQGEHPDHAWKPLFLRWSTLLLLLGLIGALVILLQSASLAFGKGVSDTTTQSTTQIHVVVVETEVVSSAASVKQFLATDSGPSTTFTTRTGWISSKSSTGGWMAQQGAPTTTGSWPSHTPKPSGPVTSWSFQNQDVILSWETEYFIGTFLPTLLASLFANPWRLIDHDTKTLEPFAHLSRPGGGTAARTILLHYEGISGLVRVITQSPSPDHVVVTLSTLLMYSAALLSPLAAVSVRMGLEGDCLQDYRLSCTGTLRASDKVIRGTQALLCLVGCFTFAYCLLLGATWRKRAFGVTSDPRSILGIAKLSLNPFLTAALHGIPLQRSDGSFCGKEAAYALRSTSFQFGYVSFPPADQEYAILVSDENAGRLERLEESVKLEDRNTTDVPSHDISPSPATLRRRLLKSTLMVKIAVFALLLAALISMILWYLFYPDTDTDFERFMNSEKFGVRFLFTLFGVLIGFGWGAVLSGKPKRDYEELDIRTDTFCRDGGKNAPVEHVTTSHERSIFNHDASVTEPLRRHRHVPPPRAKAACTPVFHSHNERLSADIPCQRTFQPCDYSDDF